MLRCPECGTPYRQITGGNKQYCSERCRKRAERKRWKAKRKEFEQVSPAEQKRTKDARDSIFCSPTCYRSYRWKHGKKRKYQSKAQQIARMAKQEFPGSKWERVLNPNNSVDRIFIYGY